MDVRIDQGAESFDALKPRIEIETQLARQRQVGALSCGGDDPVNRADPLHSFGCLALKRGWRSRPFVFEGMAEVDSRVVAKRPFTPTKFSTSWERHHMHRLSYEPRTSVRAPAASARQNTRTIFWHMSPL